MECYAKTLLILFSHSAFCYPEARSRKECNRFMFCTCEESLQLRVSFVHSKLFLNTSESEFIASFCRGHFKPSCVTMFIKLLRKNPFAWCFTMSCTLDGTVNRLLSVIMDFVFNGHSYTSSKYRKRWKGRERKDNKTKQNRAGAFEEWREMCNKNLSFCFVWRVNIYMYAEDVEKRLSCSTVERSKVILKYFSFST